MMEPYARAFGRHVRSLRKARGLTQDQLAERSGLAADTIRRCERGVFAASIETIRKLCAGLDIATSTLFDGLEHGRFDGRRELLDLITSCDPDDLPLVTSVVRTLIQQLQAARR